MDNANNDLLIPNVINFIEIRPEIIKPDIPIPFDLYVFFHPSKFVLLRKEDDVLQSEKRDVFIQKNQKLYVPRAIKEKLEKYLRSEVTNPELKIEEKTRVLKESAYFHLDAIFTNANVTQAIEDSVVVVKEMVNTIVTNPEAIKNLLLLSKHDYYTYNHSVDVGVYSMAIAKKLFPNDKDKILKIGLAGFFHDIGKSKVKLDIINKSSKLDEKEWNEMKMHPVFTKEILDAQPKHIISPEISLIAVEHHENFDGSGYPYGLTGKEIHVLAKILAIADVFDALTTNRSYSKALAPLDAIKLMMEVHGKKFDPAFFKLFSDTIKVNKIENLHEIKKAA